MCTLGYVLGFLGALRCVFMLVSVDLFEKKQLCMSRHDDLWKLAGMKTFPSCCQLRGLDLDNSRVEFMKGNQKPVHS